MFCLGCVQRDIPAGLAEVRPGKASPGRVIPKVAVAILPQQICRNKNPGVKEQRDSWVLFATEEQQRDQEQGKKIGRIQKPLGFGWASLEMKELQDMRDKRSY